MSEVKRMKFRQPKCDPAYYDEPYIVPTIWVKLDYDANEDILTLKEFSHEAILRHVKRILAPNHPTMPERTRKCRWCAKHNRECRNSRKCRPTSEAYERWKDRVEQILHDEYMAIYPELPTENHSTRKLRAMVTAAEEFGIFTLLGTSKE
jgi:NAD(P)H-nitrite reductase large subunit